jgi:hypothetical protein
LINLENLVNFKNFSKYQLLPKIGSKAVCWFGDFNISPKGTEAKEASNLLAFLKS